MKTKYFKKTVAGLLCCVLFASAGCLGSMAVTKMLMINGQTAFSDGHVYLQNSGQADVSFKQIDESFFAPNDPDHFKYNEAATDWLMPGGSKSGTLEVANGSSKPVHLYLYAGSTGSNRPKNGDVAQEYIDFKAKNSTAYSAAALQAASEQLVKNYLTLDVYTGNDQTDRIYTGDLQGSGNIIGSLAPSTGTKKMSDSRAIDLGEIAANGTVKLNFTLKASTAIKSVAPDGSVEKTLGLTNGYADTVAMVDWIFIAEYAVPDPTPEEPKEPEKPVPVPKTGEAAVPYTAAAAACGVSALVIYFVTFGNVGKKKKEEA